tara:strand:- start:499 stop:1866 length:1368 start_codon:yes stop_codon:yes gene_type:complete
MSVERVLPKTLDYTDVLPLAVESKARRRTFFPTNGASFTSDGANIIRIDLSADALLDTQHSYLRFTVGMTGAGNTAGIDYAGGHSFIRRLRVEQSGTVLEDIQSYNRLMGAIVLPCMSGNDHKATRTLTEAIRGDGQAVGAIATGTVATAADAATTLRNLGIANNGEAQIANGAANSYTFCIPLTSGLLNSEKLVPLMLMSAPLTIEIELASQVQAVVQSAAAVQYTVDNVRYIANLVEVGQDVSQQLRMLQEVSGGVLTLAGQTYRHFTGAVANTTSNVINVPARVKSMKSIFFASQGAAADARTTFDIGTGGHMNLNEFSVKIGSVTYPPTPVRCNGMAVGSTAEPLYELEKAWGNVGSRAGLGSETARSTFYTQESARATTGQVYRFAPFGLDMEAFQRVAIESGVNTADRSLPISLILEHSAAATATNLDIYILADALFYINQDGSMSVSV